MPRKTFLRFHFPDTATGSPAAPLSTGVQPPAVTPAGKEGGDGNSVDISNYNPPDISLSEIMSEEEPKPPKPGAAKPGEPKPTPAAAVPEKGGTPKPGEALKAQGAEISDNEKDPVKLRQAYAQTKTTLAEKEKAIEDLLKELETAKATGNQEFQKQLTEREEKIKSLKTERAEMERQLTLQNPLANKELREVETAFNNDMSKVFRRVPKFQAEFTPLVQEYLALDPRADDYATKLQEFRDKLDNGYGRDGDKVFDAIEQAGDFHEKRGALREKIQREGSQIIAKEQATTWSNASQRISETIEQAMSVPEDIAASAPYHPAIVLQKIEKVIPEADRKKIDEEARRLITTALVGFKPKTAEDYRGMDAAQIAQAQQQERAQLISMHRNLVQQAFIGIKLMRYIPGFFKDYMALDEERARKATANPPDPTRRGKEKDEVNGNGKDELDINTYEPPPPMSMSELVSS